MGNADGSWAVGVKVDVDMKVGKFTRRQRRVCDGEIAVDRDTNSPAPDGGGNRLRSIVVGIEEEDKASTALFGCTLRSKQKHVGRSPSQSDEIKKIELCTR
jgi:hypothetical protein